MTLPAGGPWPPYPHSVALAQQAVWSAWLVGDPDGLVAAYADVGGSVDTPFFNFENGKSGQYGGGVINKVARFFWARPSLSGQRKPRLHVPLAADIATASSDLLFSEPPQFTATDDGNDAARQRVDDLLNTGDFHADLIEAAEIAAALGGVYLRLVWDTDVADHVMVDAVGADAAIGEWRWGKLEAVTFFTEWAHDQEVIRHLERHEPGAILHGLYRGDAKTLGEVIALTEHPDTAPYAELVNDESAILTGVTDLTAAYVANMRPQRRWRKAPELNRLGRSDFDGCEPMMDALDETYTSWMRDVRLAKARLLVPEDMLTSLGKGQGAMFDQDQEVFTGLNIMQTRETPQAITAQQFAIRVAEHQQTAATLTDEILRAAGYSPATFGMGGDGAMATATEVVSRERQSARTRSKKCRYWSQALEPLLTTWLELDALIFKSGARGAVEVEWADVSQPDPEALSRTVETLNRAVAASLETKVRMVHQDWDEAEIQAEVEAIRKEGALTDVGPLPTDFGGNDGQYRTTPSGVPKEMLTNMEPGGQ
jgi:A118 family predicted phage portal protein